MSQKLTSKQQKAIYLLARGDTIIAAAKALNMRRETLSRWRKIPEFIVEYEKLMVETRASLSHQITSLLEISITDVKQEIKQYNGDPKRIQALLNMIKTLEKDAIT